MVRASIPERVAMTNSGHEVENELSQLNYDKNDRSWKYLHVPCDLEGKEKLIQEFCRFYYRPADIEKIIEQSAPVYEPESSPVDQSEGNDEDTTPTEAMTPSEKRHLAILKLQRAKLPEIIKAAVFATEFCIHSEKPPKKGELYGKLLAKFGDVVIKKEINEMIWVGIRDQYKQYVHGAGRDKKSNEEFVEDEE